MFSRKRGALCAGVVGERNRTPLGTGAVTLDWRHSGGDSSRYVEIGS